MSGMRHTTVARLIDLRRYLESLAHDRQARLGNTAAGLKGYARLLDGIIVSHSVTVRDPTWRR